MILENYAKEVDRLLGEFFERKKADLLNQSLPDFGMLERVEEFCLGGGKRLRPALVYFGYLLGGGEKSKEVVKLSIIMELIHAYLLIHDDFMDESDMRRGRPTIHKYYEKECQNLDLDSDQTKHLSESLAVLAGDLAECLWSEILLQSDFPLDVKNEVLLKINQSVQTTILGQELDLRLEARGLAKVDEILEMYRLKTAKYTFECPLQVGLILSGKAESLDALITRYALSAGLSFQIKDDLLGLFGDENKTGKSALDDLRRGKQTILIAKALELSSPEDRRLIEQSLGRPDLEIETVRKIKEIIKTGGALLFAEKIMLEEAAKAKQVLIEMRSLGSSAEAVNFLESLIQFIIEREN